MILHDTYALHRKWWDIDWMPSERDQDWTEWDFILADVFQTIEDYTDKSTGQFMPFDQSGSVWWEVRSMFSGSQAAIDAEKKRRGELKDGESLYAIPLFGDHKPTLAEWAEDMTEDKADLRPPHLRDARPPTPEELAAMSAEQNSTT